MIELVFKYLSKYADMHAYVRNLFLDIHLNVMMAKALGILPFGVFMIKCGECSNHHEKSYALH